MKIPDSIKWINQQNMMKTLSEEQTQKILEKGDLIKGKVLSIKANVIALQVDQLLISVQTDDPSKLTLGKNHQFLVVEDENQEKKIEMLSVKQEEGAQKKDLPLDDKMANLLKYLGIPEKKENIDLLKLFIKEQIPIQPETLKQVNKMTMQIQNFIQSAEQAIQNKEVFTKDAIFTFFKKDAIMPILKSEHFIHENTLAHENIKSSVPAALQPLFQSLDLNFNLFTHEVVEQLKSLSSFDLMKINQHQIPFNLFHLMFVANQHTQKWTENQAMEKIFHLLTGNKQNDLAQQILPLIQNEQTPEEKTESLIAFFKNIQLSQENSHVKSQTTEQLEFLKHNIRLPQISEDPFYFLQVPIKDKDESESRLDLYVQKRKAYKQGERFHLLLAMKTKKYSEVRCLIVLDEKKSYTLTFYLENKAFLNVFQQSITLIKERLALLNIQLQNIHFKVSDGSMAARDELKNILLEEDIATIDFKI